MTYLYRCEYCGELELNTYGIRECPVCNSPIRRIYSILMTQVKRGWTDVPPESRYENWSPEEKAVARERGV